MEDRLGFHEIKAPPPRRGAALSGIRALNIPKKTFIKTHIATTHWGARRV